MIVSPRPASTRGAYRDRHGRGKRDAVDVRMLSASCADERIVADGEIVRSRSPDAGIKPCGTFSKATVAKKPGAPRGSRISRKTIARGMPVVPAEPVVACVRKSAPSLHARLAGAASIRHSLLPLLFEGSVGITRACRAAGMRTHVIA